MHKAGFVNIVRNPNVGKVYVDEFTGRRTNFDYYVEGTDNSS